MTLTTTEVQNLLADLMVVAEEEGRAELAGHDTETYQNAGILTNDAGLVLRLEDGTTFQITIVQSS